MNSVLKKCFASQEYTQILLLGLDGGGKSTLLHRLKLPAWKAEQMSSTLSKLRKYHEWPENGDAPDDVADDAIPVLFDSMKTENSNMDHGPGLSQQGFGGSGSSGTGGGPGGPGGGTKSVTNKGGKDVGSKGRGGGGGVDSGGGGPFDSKYGYVADAGYNYELFFGKPFDHGLWDLPGLGEAALPHLWAAFYRMIKYHAIIYVISSTENTERLATCRKHIDFLLSEEELRTCALIILINSKRDSPYDVQRDNFHHQLGLHRLSKRDGQRTKQFVVDIMNVKGSRDSNWLQILEFVRRNKS